MNRAVELVTGLEREGFRLSIWGKNRIRINSPLGLKTVVSPERMAQLIEERTNVVEYLRARAAVQMASPQRREEVPVIPVQGRPLTEQQLRFVDALTRADSVSEAGRIAGYGTRQASHKAYRTILGFCVRHSELGASGHQADNGLLRLKGWASLKSTGIAKVYESSSLKTVGVLPGHGLTLAPGWRRMVRLS